MANSRTGAVIYAPPPPSDVPGLMHELVEWVRSESAIHPVLVAGIAQFQLVHIHPFVDGNGRTSRLLSTLCLYRAGYDFKRLFTISEYYDRDGLAFYAALQQVREQGYGPDGLARLLRCRPFDPAAGGQGTRGAGYPPWRRGLGRAGAGARERHLTKGRVIVRGKLVTRGKAKFADYVLSPVSTPFARPSWRSIMSGPTTVSTSGSLGSASELCL